MCTLTWWRGTGGSFEVFFNRDEKKTRSRAQAPRRFVEGGLEYLSPRDPDAGGTWMVANAKGVVVCLLNRWNDEFRLAGAATSRGLLVERMAVMENVPAVEEQLRSEDLAQVRPFTLVAFDGVGERGFSWAGNTLERVALEMPLCSSSYRHEEVVQARRVRFAELVGAGGGGLEQFHADVVGGASAQTVRMCRSDAQTMSRSRVTVGADAVQWDYWEEQPDFAGAPELHRTGLDRE